MKMYWSMASISVCHLLCSCANPASAQKAITAFSFSGYSWATGTIDEAGGKISVALSPSAPRTGLVAVFTTSGTSVQINGNAQLSGTTPNDFSNPVVYTVVAEDGSTKTYTVTVTKTTVVYTAGCHNNGEKCIPCFWTQTTRTDLPGDSPNASMVGGIFVAAGTVYTAGFYTNDGGIDIPC
jgi:hypothetical protein